MLYVVTAVHNRIANVPRFAASLLRQTEQPFTLVLVDDGSTDGTAAEIRKLIPHLIVLQGDGTLWWGGALDLAYRHLTADAAIPDTDSVLFTNDDLTLPEGHFARGLALLDAHPDAMITGCGVGLSSGVQIDGAVNYDFIAAQDTVLSGTAEGNCASTRQLFLRMKTLRRVDGFHPHLLRHYLADYAFTIRAARRGVRILADESLLYSFDEQMTGLRLGEEKSFKQLLERKSMANPKDRLFFLFLVTPAHLLPAALWNQCKRYLQKVPAALVRTRK